jgi:hypothetical protein
MVQYYYGLHHTATQDCTWQRWVVCRCGSTKQVYPSFRHTRTCRCPSGRSAVSFKRLSAPRSPPEIISDRDPLFMSKFWTSHFKMLHKLRPSSAYHPETDGQTEVVNRKVEEMLCCFVNHHQSNWYLFLVDLEFAYKSAPLSTTTISPFLSHVWFRTAIQPYLAIAMLQLRCRRLLVQHKRRDVNCSFCHHPRKLNHSIPIQSTSASLLL